MARPRAIASRESARRYPDERTLDQSPGKDEFECGQSDKKTRQRNSVACARCRKRKIKCKGDLHNGQGCEACQAAGVSGSSCYYLRVNSHQLDDVALDTPSGSDWPYTHPGPPNLSSSAGRITSDPSQYSLGNANVTSPSTPILYPGQAQFNRAQPFTNTSCAAQSAIPLRQSLPLQYHGSFENNVLHHHGMQSASNGSPTYSSQVSTPTYFNQDLNPHWVPLSLSEGPVYNNAEFEHYNSPRYASSVFSYSASSGESVPAVTAKGSSLFSGLSPLATRLPNNGDHRILPNPEATRSSFSSNDRSYHEHRVAGPFRTVPPPNANPDNQWHSEQVDTSGSQSFVSSASVENTGASGPASSTSSFSSCDSHETASCGYNALSSSSSHALIMDIPPFTQVNPQIVVDLQDNGQRTETSSRQLGRLGEAQMPRLNAHTRFRGMEADTAEHSAPIQGSIASGHVPNVIQPRPRHAPTRNAVLQGSFEKPAQHSYKNDRARGADR